MPGIYVQATVKTLETVRIDSFPHSLIYLLGWRFLCTWSVLIPSVVIPLTGRRLLSEIFPPVHNPKSALPALMIIAEHGRKTVCKKGR